VTVPDTKNPLNRTDVPLAPPKKPLPLTVRTKFVVPAVTVFGEMEVIPGTGFRTVKGMEFDVVAVFTTATLAAPPVARLVGGIVAVSCVVLEAVGVSVTELPLIVKLIVDVPGINPFPFTVKVVIAALPALAVNGEIEVIPNAAGFPRLRSHTPRPCVAARSVREGLCKVIPRISAFGIEPDAPRGDQLVPPVVVKKAPMSVPM